MKQLGRRETRKKEISEVEFLLVWFVWSSGNLGWKQK
jgi:hypothetical protein